MRFFPKAFAQIRTLAKARRNRTDLLRYMIRRPALLGAIAVYETAELVSGRVDTRLKMLAGTKTTSLIGCPF
jgi:hypothetical protein